MNDPALDAVDEARWAAGHKFDFLDLTMEGPAAAKEQLDVPALRKVLDDTGLGIVGHNAWYLPFGSPVKELRAGAIAAVEATFDPFATLGTKLVNVHVDKGVGAFAYDDTVRWNAECFATLAERAKPYGITLMIENVVNNLNNAKAMRVMLDAHPDLRFHLDIAHANVRGDRTKEYLRAHSNKLVHVHVSDNKRTSDDHLPLGVGDINWPEQLGMLKDTGYDGTITLEIFTPERDFLLDSAQRVRQVWQQS